MPELTVDIVLLFCGVELKSCKLTVIAVEAARFVEVVWLVEAVRFVEVVRFIEVARLVNDGVKIFVL